MLEMETEAQGVAGPEGATWGTKFHLKTHFSSLSLLSRMLIADKF